jgi:hypothetical protein
VAASFMHGLQVNALTVPYSGAHTAQRLPVYPGAHRCVGKSCCAVPSCRAV